MSGLQGGKVLIAEDDAVTALLLEEEFVLAGFTVAGPFATCAAASRWLKTDTPSGAILDHDLQDGPCTDVAAELLQRGVPFIVLSGHEPDVLSGPMKQVTYVAKPSGLYDLPAKLAKLLVQNRIDVHKPS